MTANVSLTELTQTSFKIGCLSFGGPAGQIALMHRIFVDEKKWIKEDHFLRALNFCMLLPGPEAQQLATYVGWILRGVRGGVICGALFVLPGAAVVLALSWIYARFGDTPAVHGVFFGVKAAVIALVLEAMMKIARRALKSAIDYQIAFCSFALIAIFQLPYPLIIVSAAIAGLFRARGHQGAPSQAAREPRPATRKVAATAALFIALWLTPLMLLSIFAGPNHVTTQVAILFSKLSVVTFGGAYAVLAYLQQQAVETYAWLSAGQMIDGLGLAETTPGPLILVNQFVGFMSGWQSEDGGLLLALACAAIASWQTFAASYVWIFAGAPYAERLQQSPMAKYALVSISAAVIGVIASLGFMFAANTLFSATLSLSLPGGAAFIVPDIFSTKAPALALTLAAIAMLHYRTNIFWVILACAVGGLLLS